tara:strand:- start:1464 stop:1943 length:480 start_codon:yes stop_codon:yes gene_type:complete
MSATHIRVWDRDYRFTSQGYIVTKLFDMGDSTTIKDIYNIILGFQGITNINIQVDIYYRFTPRDDWVKYGSKGIDMQAEGTLEIKPQKSITTDGNKVVTTVVDSTGVDTEIEFVKLTNVKTIQFKIELNMPLSYSSTISLTELSIEYRKRRSKNIEVSE